MRETSFNDSRVSSYFDKVADRFDTIYRSDKSIGKKLVDGLFRSVVHRRFDYTMGLLSEVQGKRVLDVGCGSARYGIELARQGANIVGLDFASGMVEIAKKAAQEAGVADICSFAECDFLSWNSETSYDICLAIGFFDYIQKPRVFLKRMNELNAEDYVFSFPKRWTLRTLPRWIRLNASGCPVYFYDLNQISKLLIDVGWSDFKIESLSRDYLVHVGR
ncbi:MAG: methyltransferase domain-containing protein [Candidatus Latescibacterota bacterium]|nr:methyltransferase domain-containing protein [Candidatus Latescibacterota bacterium]